MACGRPCKSGEVEALAPPGHGLYVLVELRGKLIPPLGQRVMQGVWKRDEDHACFNNTVGGQGNGLQLVLEKDQVCGAAERVRCGPQRARGGEQCKG